MQPIFLKELIPHREFQIIRDQNQSTLIEQNDEENKEEDELNEANIFEEPNERISRKDGRYPVSPASTWKR
jgi:hypothetical protein